MPEPSNEFEPPEMSLDFGRPNPYNTEPDSNMRTMARANWHCYCAHIQEGFTVEQAMLVVQTIVSSALLQNNQEGNNND